MPVKKTTTTKRRKTTSRAASKKKTASRPKRTTAKRTTAKRTTAKRTAKRKSAKARARSRRPSKKVQNHYIAEIKSLVKRRGDFMKGYQVGETVVEPSIGVCHIAGVKSQAIDGKIEDYYIFNSGSAKVYVPMSQIEKRGVRRPMTQAEIRKIINQLRVPVSPSRSDARMQYLAYREIMRSGDPAKISRLLRELYTLDKMDELKGKEKEIMEQAKKFLVDEISFIQEHPKAEVLESIETQLDQMYKRKQAKDKEARSRKSAASG